MNRVPASVAVARAKARYLNACRGGPDGRELPLVELAQRNLEWQRAIVAEIDESLEKAAERRRNEVAEAVLAMREQR